MSELGGTINKRIGDLRTSMNLSQTELSEKTGIPMKVKISPAFLTMHRPILKMPMLRHFSQEMP